MVATAVHLVRHGEVFNPAGVIYGRLADFRLSDRGRAMAAAAAEALADRPVTRVIASPLLRAQQSAAPIVDRFGLPLESDDRVIEAGNVFEGRVTAGGALLRTPADWRYFVNPARPSWGEPFRRILERMRAAVDDAFTGTESGEAVIVSHQLPIWTMHRAVAGRPLAHDPRHRRCALSSITSFGRLGGVLVETAYADPGAAVTADAVDEGAA